MGLLGRPGAVESGLQDASMLMPPMEIAARAVIGMDAPPGEYSGQHLGPQAGLHGAAVPFHEFADVQMLGELANAPKRGAPDQHCAGAIARHRLVLNAQPGGFGWVEVGTDK